jgi:hypothetical protein
MELMIQRVMSNEKSESILLVSPTSRGMTDMSAHFPCTHQLQMEASKEGRRQ